MNKICELIYDISPHSFFMLFSSVISLHQHGGSGDVSPDGGRGGAPASPSLHPADERGEQGRRSRRARRARASAGSASRAEPGEGENRCRRYALKRGFGDVSPDGGRGRSPCFTQSPPGRRARRAGRRSRRARRARASAGSASRAEPGEGENRCRRYALKRGFGGRVPRRGCGGGAPANGTCPPTGVRGRSPCKWDVSPPIRPQGRRPFNASLRLSAPYYSAAYPRTRIARRISHKIIGRGVDYDSPADYLRNGEALSVYRAESKSVV